MESLKRYKKWRPFMSKKDLKRWKRECGVKLRRKKGNWGTWDQRLWKIFDPDHPFNN